MYKPTQDETFGAIFYDVIKAYQDPPNIGRRLNLHFFCFKPGFGNSKCNFKQRNSLLGRC